MTWTQFFDVSSGGSEKTNYPVIWIEAPEEEACELFQRIFGHDPQNTTCPCCGEDYSISEYDELEAEDGHAVVTVDDIARLRSGSRIEHQN